MRDKVGVGATIGEWLREWGVNNGQGCECPALLYDMDEAGPELILEDVERWAERMHNSAKTWERLPEDNGKTDRLWSVPPLAAFKRLITRACYTVSQLENPDAEFAEATPRECDNLTLCVTYYKRPFELDRLLKSIPEGMKVLVQDTEGNLSRGRNQLMQRCETEYALVMEEDMIWRPDTDPWRMIDVLEGDDLIAFAGGSLIDTRMPWRHNFMVHNIQGEPRPHLYAFESRDQWKVIKGTRYQPCDLIANFGVLRAEFGRSHPWEEKAELGEHEDWFLGIQKAGKRVAYVPQCKVNHISSRPSREYAQMRGRARKFWPVVEEKHNMAFMHPTITRRKPLNIVVLGIGNSNTSIVTEQLGLLGWNLGAIDLQYHENIAVRALNEEMLRGDWAAARRASNILADLPQPWAIKDPRFRGTLHNWLPAFCEYEPVLLWLTKDLKDVIKSFNWRGEPVNKIKFWHERCKEYFESWPWARKQIDVQQIARAIEQWDPKRTPVK